MGKGEDLPKGGGEQLCLGFWGDFRVFYNVLHGFMVFLVAFRVFGMRGMICSSTEGRMLWRFFFSHQFLVSETRSKDLNTSFDSFKNHIR